MDTTGVVESQDTSEISQLKGVQPIVGLVFYPGGQIYYFSPGSFPCKRGDRVIVSTTKGFELGVVQFTHDVDPSTMATPLKKIKGLATAEDLKDRELFSSKEKEAFQKARAKIREHKLPMKLVGAHYNYNGKRLTFFFTAEGRVDFRELVKDLASTFCTRIDLKQIGPKDEARLIGGMGVCGQNLCCRDFLVRPPTTSVKMAQNQDLGTKNPDKISGQCGRLMCCLNYEDEVYKSLRAELIQPGTVVTTPEGRGRILEVRVLKNTMLVEVEGQVFRRMEFPVDKVVVSKQEKA